MVIREIFARLGLHVDAGAFLKAGGLIEGLRVGYDKLLEGAGHLATSFIENIRATAESGHELEKTAQITGLATDSLQRLQKAANMAGVENDGLNTGIRLLSRNMLAAKEGSDAHASAFHKLGISYKDGSGKLRGADEVIKEIADKFEKMPDGAEKVALSMKLLGRSGSQLIPMLNLGRARIEEFGAEATIMNKEQIEASKEMVLAGKQLKSVLASVWKSAIFPLIPALRDLVKQWTAWVKANASLLKQKIKEWVGYLIAGVEALSTALRVVAGVFTLLGDNLGAVKVVAVLLAGAFAALEAEAVVAAAASIVAWLAAAAPFILIAAFVAMLLLQLDDLRVWLKGGKSLFGDWLKLVDIWAKPGGQDGWFLSQIKEFVVQVRRALELFREFYNTVGVWQGGKNMLSAGWDIRKQQIGDWLGGRKPTANANSPMGFEMASPSLVGSGFSGAPMATTSKVVHQTINVTQLPGEDGEHFAQRVSELSRQEQTEANESAAQSLPPAE